MSLVTRINQYVCDACGGVITTIDFDEGTTPFILGCRATENCGGSMFSRMYQVDQTLTPGWGWYKSKKLPKGVMRNHVKMGGLLLRKIGKNDK